MAANRLRKLGARSRRRPRRRSSSVSLVKKSPQGTWPPSQWDKRPLHRPGRHDYPPPLELLQAGLQGLRLSLYGTDLSHRLATVRHRDRPPFTYVTDDLRKPRLGFGHRVHEIHACDLTWLATPAQSTRSEAATLDRRSESATTLLVMPLTKECCHQNRRQRSAQAVGTARAARILRRVSPRAGTVGRPSLHGCWTRCRRESKG